MIKSFLNILFFLILSFTVLLAQESTEKEVSNKNLDARKVLMQQIDKARQQELKTNDVINPASYNISSVDTNSNKSSLRIIFFIVEGSLLLTLYYLWKKSRDNRKRQVHERFKRQIQKIRQEKIGSPPRDYLSKIRRGLKFFPSSLENSGKEITLRAKKYSLSKGELHLAAKLKLLMEGRR